MCRSIVLRRVTAVIAVAVGTLTWSPATAYGDGDWFEDFDSYDLGGGMHGQGGWEGWFGDPGADAFVTDAQALSGPHSLDIDGSADLVRTFSGKNSGQWTFTAWQYIPGSFSGETYFILMNTYGADEDNNWSSQVQFDSAGVVQSEFDGAELPLITDAWVELRVEIDLNTDVQSFYYGGAELYTKSWTDGVSGNGALNIGSVDLFGNGASSVYYDNMSLVPAPGTAVLLALGAAFTRRRRRNPG